MKEGEKNQNQLEDSKSRGFARREKEERNEHHTSASQRTAKVTVTVLPPPESGTFPLTPSTDMTLFVPTQSYLAL